VRSFVAAIWHTLGVVSAPLYWLLSFLFLWGGAILIGEDRLMGQAAVWLVLGLLAARFAPPVRKLSARVRNVLGCAAFGVFALIASVV